MLYENFGHQRLVPVPLREGACGVNKYRTLATNTLLLSIGTFGSKLLVLFHGPLLHRLSLPRGIRDR